MARRVFFSFHYELDIWRASQVRNCWVGRDREDAGFWDSASWEAVKRQGDDAVKRWINTQLNNTSVTVVLIGAQTASRPYVLYEICQSYDRGNGLLGITIHNIRDQRRIATLAGANPFASVHVAGAGGHRVYLSQVVRIYDWVIDRGYQNCVHWIEAAARSAGR